MIGQTLRHYRILDKLGAGGMGEVYRALDERLGRDVALKVLSTTKRAEESSRLRFRREALALSKLNHPNIATIFEYDTEDEVDFLVMEYIHGPTLNDKLAAGPLPEEEVVLLAKQIADALEEAHTLGVVHRDLKPSNILVTPKGQAKVLDFGLARLALTTDDAATLIITESHVIVGSLPYMSPEQLRGESIDARTDIYSLGVVLYEMSCGQRPFPQNLPTTLADAIFHQPPPRPSLLKPDLSPGLEPIILKCLEKDPESRYQSCKELLADLSRLTMPNAAIAVYSSAPRNQSRSQATGIRSIIALPSKVYGPEEDRFLTDAIPNTLSTRLVEVEGVETKVPPTSIAVERVGGDLARIAEAYDVNAFILSSVTILPDQFILNVQLVEARSRRLLWTREYEGKRENYLALVRRAAEGCRTALRPEGSPILLEVDRANEAKAELFYQRGLYHWNAYANRKQPKDFDNALSSLKHALDLDPRKARAAASIATLYVAKLEAGVPLSEVLPEIDKWAERALQLDDHAGEAWQVLSVAEEFRPGGDQRKRLEYALKAATYADYSGYSHQVLGTALARSSYILALEALREDMRQDPLHLNGPLFASYILSRMGKMKDSLSLIDNVLSIERDMPVAVLQKAMMLLLDHRLHEAEALVEPIAEMVLERRLPGKWSGFFLDYLEFERSADKVPSEEVLGRLVKLARGQESPFPRWEMLTQNVLIMQARHDSIEALLETLSLRASAGIVEAYDWLLKYPDLAPLRKEERFQSVLARSRSEFEGLLATLDEARERGELPSYLERPLAEVRYLSAFEPD